MSDDEFDIRPGRSDDSGARSYRKARTLVGQVLQASRRAGHTPLRPKGMRRGTGHLGRGKRAALQRRRSAFQRRVIVKARVVRHRSAAGSARLRSAPLARHVAYLERDGVTRDGSRGQLFDERSDRADGDSFAARCEDDRHHFRFIVSPEDASDMTDLRAFTRELMEDMAGDLGTRLDWVAVDHWNTGNPHIHVLVRGVAGDGKDLVIDRSYIGEGMRARAQERVTAELGPRSERDIRNALRREVAAERFTSLDRRLARLRDDRGVIDLRPEGDPNIRKDRTLLVGRVQVLERMSLAERVGPASWSLRTGAEAALRELADRGDIIRTMHRAMSGQDRPGDRSRFALHSEISGDRIVGRLVERGLHNELTADAYAIVDGVDGRAHHLRFPDIDRTGDAAPGAIVELSSWNDRKGRLQATLLVRSDLPIERQVHARGATWLDRQLVSPEPHALSGGFGAEVREALAARTDALAAEGLAKRQGSQATFVRNLLGALRARDLADAAQAIEAGHGLVHRPVSPGDHIAGTYRERLALASGRFAMIDDGLGFQLVPWRQDLDRRLGQAVTGRVNERGGVDWNFGRSRGPSV